jgi:uncharacterized coiled-coil DUF342 family protein
MNETLFEKARKAQRPASYCLIENKKALVIKRIEAAIQKLKETRREVRKLIQQALEMKEAGDDIANQVIAAVAEAFASDGNSWILRDYITKTNCA